jgi:hypothetical protein
MIAQDYGRYDVGNTARRLAIVERHAHRIDRYLGRVRPR